MVVIKKAIRILYKHTEYKCHAEFLMSKPIAKDDGISNDIR